MVERPFPEGGSGVQTKDGYPESPTSCLLCPPTLGCALLGGRLCFQSPQAVRCFQGHASLSCMLGAAHHPTCGFHILSRESQ